MKCIFSFLLNPLTLMFLGAFFGGFIGYEFNVHQKNQESKEKRVYLKRRLLDEIQKIDSNFVEYNVDKAFVMDSISISSLDLILDEGVLSYESDGELITRLLNLKVAIAKYNNRIQVTNLAQTLTPVPDKIHHQMYNDVQRLHGNLISARDEVFKFLGK